MLKKLNESIAIANICTQLYRCYCWLFNPLIATLKPCTEQWTIIQQYGDWYTGR